MRPFVVVDTRERPLVEYERISDSYWIPLDSLGAMKHALPPRSVEHLIFVINESSAPSVADASCGEPQETYITSVVGPLGYLEVHVTTLCGALALCRRLEGERGIAPSVALTNGPLGKQMPCACWQPNVCLAQFIDTVETDLRGAGVALDIGSGSGRDAVFLACRGWHVVALDNRSVLLEQAAALAHHHSTCCDTLCMSLRQSIPYRPGCCDLVHVSRFLHRATLPLLFTLPRVGGYLLYHHFLDGCQHTPVGTPASPAGFLYRNELAELATSEASRYTYRVLVDVVVHLDDGRPMINFLALRTA